jgi:hypothetical protein
MWLVAWNMPSGNVAVMWLWTGICTTTSCLTSVAVGEKSKVGMPTTFRKVWKKASEGVPRRRGNKPRLTSSINKHRCFGNKHRCFGNKHRCFGREREDPFLSCRRAHCCRGGGGLVACCRCASWTCGGATASEHACRSPSPPSPVAGPPVLMPPPTARSNAAAAAMAAAMEAARPTGR